MNTDGSKQTIQIKGLLIQGGLCLSPVMVTRCRSYIVFSSSERCITVVKRFVN